MKSIVSLVGLLLLCGLEPILRSAAAAGAPLYRNDFENITPGSIPDDFLVLDGGFTVRQEAANKFLELPGAPLETFGVLFGPNEKENVSVSARIYGTGKA